MSYRGKRVWIIGASAGIGEALARALLTHGAYVILSARDGDALAKIASGYINAEVVPVDLARRESLEHAVAEIAPESLDLVICTAALYDPSRVADLDPARTEALVRVNLLGTLHVAQLAPRVLAKGGQLALFGSVAGYFGLPRGQAYSATKAAVNNIAESLRIELAPDVDVRLVCPGFVRSRLTDKNDFEMPAIISADEAAARVLEGLKSRHFELHFPKRFTLMIKLLRALPYGLSMRLVRRLG